MNIVNRLKASMYRIIESRRFLRQQKAIVELIENEDFVPIADQNLSKCNKVTFIIPGMIKHSGGRTSILRLGTSLSKQGYQVNYVSYIEQPVDEMEKNAKINLESYQGKFYSKDALYKVQGDVIIATNWQSVYYAKRCNGYKMYFIQDYEPYFHPYGEFFLLAKKTYQLGFHMVSLGAWNKYKIEKECNIKGIDIIDFPYEGDEYSYKKRDYTDFRQKKEYKVAVYIKKDGKRLPVLVQIMLKKAKELFEEEGIKLEIFFFGMDGKEKVIVGNNLGKLNKQQLESFYHTVDFGMVASMSNISLVPYEMISTGLPVIEFEDGTFSYFFTNGSAIMTSFSYKELHDKLKQYMDNPEKLSHMQDLAYEQLRELSWESTGKQFSQIIENICR